MESPTERSSRPSPRPVPPHTPSGALPMADGSPDAAELTLRICYLRGGARVVYDALERATPWRIVLGHGVTVAYKSLWALAESQSLDFDEVQRCNALADPDRAGRRGAPLVALATEINAINRANGWEVLTPDSWSDVRHVITLLALVTTEVAEAIEAVRKDDRENFAEELADTVIRCLDIGGGLGIDLDAVVMAKLVKNRLRGHRHGGKRV